MSTWTLKYGATTQSLAAWGLDDSSLVIRRANLAADVLSVRAPGAMDAAALFAHDAAVTIYRDGTPFFVGKVRDINREGDGRTEAVTYQIAGPWWDLERLVYQQTWKVFTGDPDALSDWPSSELFLGQDTDGSPLNTGEQISDALAWAVTCGVSLQEGDIDPVVNIPTQNVRDTTVAEVIRMLLRWTPDVIAWFDYTTTPPTFHARQLANLSAVTVEPPDDKVGQIKLTPRHELVLPAVVLRFKQVGSVDGRNWIQITDQKYPLVATGQEIGASIHTIELAGANKTTLTQELVCASVAAQSGTNAARVAWWQGKDPLLSLATIDPSSLTIASATVKDDSGATVSLGSFPYELVEGALAPWLRLSGGSLASSHEVNVRALATYDLYADTDRHILLQKNRTKELNLRLRVTNAPTGTYTTVDTLTAAESIPTGLAQAIYDAHATLQYEGQFTLHGDEIPTGLGLGSKVSMVLASATYSNLLVQAVVEDVANRVLTVSVGPAAHIGISDLIELLRVNRSRVTWQNPLTRSTAVASGSSASMTLAKTPPRENTNGGYGNAESSATSADAGTGKKAVATADAKNQALKLEVLQTSDGSGVSAQGKIELKLAHCRDSGDANGKAVQVRQLKVSVKDLAGTTKQRLLLACSDAYDTSIHASELELAVSSVKWVPVVSFSAGDDYVTCTIGGSSVKVALPWQLRDARQPSGDHSIHPNYTAGNYLAVTEPDGGTGVTVSSVALTYLDLNACGRGWAQPLVYCEDGTYYTIPVVSGVKTEI
jgi:hypothetical protein